MIKFPYSLASHWISFVSLPNKGLAINKIL